MGEVLEERSTSTKNEEPGKWGWGEDTHVEKTSVVGQKVLLQAAR
jgi:hypothetical protein